MVEQVAGKVGRIRGALQALADEIDRRNDELPRVLAGRSAGAGGVDGGARARLVPWSRQLRWEMLERALTYRPNTGGGDTCHRGDAARSDAEASNASARRHVDRHERTKRSHLAATAKPAVVERSGEIDLT